MRSPGRLPKKLDVGEFLPAPNEALGIADSSEDSMNDEDRVFMNTTDSSQTTQNTEDEQVDEGGEVP